MAEIYRKVGPTSYSAGEVFTPFSRPGQSYDLPIGAWRLKAFFYRLLTLIFLGIAVLLTLVFLMLAQMPREKVFAVQVLNTGFSTGYSRLPLGSSNLLKNIKNAGNLEKTYSNRSVDGGGHHE
jgi:hypothetical protein